MGSTGIISPGRYLILINGSYYITYSCLPEHEATEKPDPRISRGGAGGYFGMPAWALGLELHKPKHASRTDLTRARRSTRQRDEGLTHAQLAPLPLRPSRIRGHAWLVTGPLQNDSYHQAQESKVKILPAPWDRVVRVLARGS